MTNVTDRTVNNLLDELGSINRKSTGTRDKKEIDPVTHVNEEHKYQIGLIKSIHAVQAHVWNSIPEAGKKTGRADVADYLEATVAPVYHLWNDTNSNGLTEGALASANVSLSYTKGFFEQGGSNGASPDLNWGDWRWVEGGREACREYIKKNSGYDPEYIVGLVADIRLNAELHEEREAEINEEPEVVEEPVIDAIVETIEEAVVEPEIVPEPVAAQEEVKEPAGLLRKAIRWVESKLTSAGILKAVD